MIARGTLVRAVHTDALLLVMFWTATLFRGAAFWTGSADGAHAFVVPLLAAYLLVVRYRTRPETWGTGSVSPWLLLAGLGGTLWIAASFFLTAFPTWPAASWALYLAAILLSLVLYGCAGGPRWAIHFAFPFAFLLTSLPLPTAIRQPMLDGLAPTVTAVAAAIVNELGVPALHHGRVIETAHGFVGVEEACAGLRSFEATLMLTLFLGEYWTMSLARKVALVAVGLGCAIGGNVVRVVVVTLLVVRHSNVESIGAHDLAGYGALAVTFAAIFAVGYLLRRGPSPRRIEFSEGKNGRCRPATLAWIYGIGVIGGTVAPLAWFAGQSLPGSSAPDAVRPDLPHGNPTFQMTSVPTTTVELLHCDTIIAGRWRTPDGIACTGYIVRWRHGHEAQFALALHNPGICLPYAGLNLAQTLPEIPVAAPLVCRGWEFSSDQGRIQVYSTSFRLPTLTPLPKAPATAVDWWHWRFDALRRHERDEDVANVTIAFDADDVDARRVADELTRIIRIRR